MKNCKNNYIGSYEECKTNYMNSYEELQKIIWGHMISFM